MVRAQGQAILAAPPPLPHRAEPAPALRACCAAPWQRPATDSACHGGPARGVPVDTGRRGAPGVAPRPCPGGDAGAKRRARGRYRAVASEQRHTTVERDVIDPVPVDPVLPGRPPPAHAPLPAAWSSTAMPRCTARRAPRSRRASWLPCSGSSRRLILVRIVLLLLDAREGNDLVALLLDASQALRGALRGHVPGRRAQRRAAPSSTSPRSRRSSP